MFSLVKRNFDVFKMHGTTIKKRNNRFAALNVIGLEILPRGPIVAHIIHIKITFRKPTLKHLFLRTRPATQETRTDDTGTLTSVQALGILSFFWTCIEIPSNRYIPFYNTQTIQICTLRSPHPIRHISIFANYTL